MNFFDEKLESYEVKILYHGRGRTVNNKSDNWGHGDTRIIFELILVYRDII